jgi:osmoprotectant transport system permease protein
MPLVMSGVRLALVQVWATATIAALVAGPGLGRFITDGFFRSHSGKGIAGALVVAAVALVLELLAALAQRAVDPSRRSTPEGGRADALSVGPATVDPPAEPVG